MFGGRITVLAAGEYEAYDSWALEPSSHTWPVFKYEADRWPEMNDARLAFEVLSTTAFNADGRIELVRLSDNGVVSSKPIYGMPKSSDMWSYKTMLLGGGLENGTTYLIRAAGTYPHLPKIRRVSLIVPSGTSNANIGTPRVGDYVGDNRNRTLLGRFPITVAPDEGQDSPIPTPYLPEHDRSIVLLNSGRVSSGSSGEISPNMPVAVKFSRMSGVNSVYLEVSGRLSDATSIFHVELVYENDSSRVRGASVAISGDSLNLFRSEAFTPENGREVVPYLRLVKGSGTAYLSAVRLIIDSEATQREEQGARESILRSRGAEELLIEEVSVSGTGNTKATVFREFMIHSSVEHEVYFEASVTNTGSSGTSTVKLIGNTTDLGSVSQGLPAPTDPDPKETAGLKATMDAADIKIDEENDQATYTATLVLDSNHADGTAKTTGARVWTDYILDEVSSTTSLTSDWALDVANLDADSSSAWSVITTNDKNTSSSWGIESTNNLDTVGSWRLDTVSNLNTVASWELNL